MLKTTIIFLFLIGCSIATASNLKFIPGFSFAESFDNNIFLSEQLVEGRIGDFTTVLSPNLIILYTIGKYKFSLNPTLNYEYYLRDKLKEIKDQSMNSFHGIGKVNLETNFFLEREISSKLILSVTDRFAYDPGNFSLNITKNKFGNYSLSSNDNQRYLFFDTSSNVLNPLVRYEFSRVFFLNFSYLFETIDLNVHKDTVTNAEQLGGMANTTIHRLIATTNHKLQGGRIIITPSLQFKTFYYDYLQSDLKDVANIKSVESSGIVDYSLNKSIRLGTLAGFELFELLADRSLATRLIFGGFGGTGFLMNQFRLLTGFKKYNENTYGIAGNADVFNYSIVGNMALRNFTFIPITKLILSYTKITITGYPEPIDKLNADLDLKQKIYGSFYLFVKYSFEQQLSEKTDDSAFKGNYSKHKISFGFDIIISDLLKSGADEMSDFL